jgi:hypothetical protein
MEAARRTRGEKIALRPTQIRIPVKVNEEFNEHTRFDFNV